VRRESYASIRNEPADRKHQAHVALADQFLQGYATASVALGNLVGKKSTDT
jgi:hypothetical protein